MIVVFRFRFQSSVHHCSPTVIALDVNDLPFYHGFSRPAKDTFTHSRNLLDGWTNKSTYETLTKNYLKLSHVCVLIYRMYRVFAKEKVSR